ncbi:MAG: DegV family protein [Oscillospiraceae bacterium]|nr:DegV family protein [Oscillospiraceae bacterium]
MIHIISDTSTLYSSMQAKEAGFDVAPLSVTIAGKTYREFDEIDSKSFVDLIKLGNMPRSSQPALGEVMALFEQYPEDEIINISMAQGLSGTYESAVSAAESCEYKDKITVVNTRSLCGPHRYMVEQAVKLVKEGKTKAEILSWLEKRMETAKSYLMPNDFEYLRRGGRLSPLVSYVGKTIKLAPVMTQTDDGCKLSMAGIKRSFKQAIQFVGDALERKGVGKGWKVYITHADAEHLAQQALEILKEKMPHAAYEIHPLSPAFITQGGPGCVAVQVVEE